MPLNVSLKNRVKRIQEELRYSPPPPAVIGVMLRPGDTLESARARIAAAQALAGTVYIGNLARLRLPKE